MALETAGAAELVEVVVRLEEHHGAAEADVVVVAGAVLGEDRRS